MTKSGDGVGEDPAKSTIPLPPLRQSEEISTVP